MRTLRARQTLFPDQRRAIERDLKACEERIQNLVNAVATGKGGEVVFVELAPPMGHVV